MKEVPGGRTAAAQSSAEVVVLAKTLMCLIRIGSAEMHQLTACHQDMMMAATS